MVALAVTAGFDLDLRGPDAGQRQQRNTTRSFKQQQGVVAGGGRFLGAEQGRECFKLRFRHRRPVVADDKATALNLDGDIFGTHADRPAQELGWELPWTLKLRDRQLAQLRLDVDLQELAQVDRCGVVGHGVV